MTALLTVTALAVTSCAPAAAPGVDGDLADSWAAFDEPGPFSPQAEVCHRSEQSIGRATDYRPVDCDGLHRAETVHVGAFTGADAQLSSVPTGNVPARTRARAECERQAAAYLGDAWQHGPLRLTVVVPAQAAWNAGARWFRCDVAQVDSVYLGETMPRTASLRDALAGGGALRLGCIDAVLDIDDYVIAMEPVDCAVPHNSEYVGAYREPLLRRYFDWEFELDGTVLHERCMQMVAEYADLPVDDDLPQRVSTIYVEPDPADIGEGDHLVRCFLFVWPPHPGLTRSVAGAGDELLPVVG